MAKHYTANDLAEYVFRELSGSKMKTSKPPENVLKELFNTLYYASLQTEEGQFIRVTITLIDHTSITKFNENKDNYDKWQFYPFTPELEFTIKNLVKLSKAADPWSSSLALYYNDEGQLYIYGMIDQSIHYQSFLNYEREDKPAHPGILQTMINGIGILNVMLDYQALATLNQDSLVKLYPNVFQFGPIAEFLKKNSCLSQRKIESLVDEKLNARESAEVQDMVLQYTIQAISRILLKIKNYHHGGAILITKDWEEDLQTKYPLKYDRISLSTSHSIKALSDSEFFEHEIEKLKREGKTMPIALHTHYDSNELDLEDAYNEMIGAIRFVASLSCVDGLVLLSPHLNVHGFGTVITEKVVPENVYISKGSKPSDAAVEMKADHFGTRHRSMFAYCNKHPDSIGFVVSQDGEIRAIKSVSGKVYVWENIKVYQFQRSSKLPKPTAKPIT